MDVSPPEVTTTSPLHSVYCQDCERACVIQWKAISMARAHLIKCTAGCKGSGPCCLYSRSISQRILRVALSVRCDPHIIPRAYHCTSKSNEFQDFKLDCTDRTSTGAHRVRHTQLDNICSSSVQGYNRLLGRFQVGIPSYYKRYEGPSASPCKMLMVLCSLTPSFLEV